MMKDKVNVNNVIDIMINPNNFVRKTLGIPASGNQYASLNKLIEITGKHISEYAKWIKEYRTKDCEEFTKIIKTVLVNSKLIENESEDKEIELKDLIPAIEIVVKNNLDKFFDEFITEFVHTSYDSVEVKKIADYILKCDLSPVSDNGRDKLRDIIKKPIVIRKIFADDTNIQETLADILTEIYSIYIEHISKDVSINDILTKENKPSKTRKGLGFKADNIGESIAEGTIILNEESPNPVEKLIPVQEKKNQTGEEISEELKQQIKEIDKYNEDLMAQNTKEELVEKEVESTDYIIDGEEYDYNEVETPTNEDVLDSPIYEENTENSTETQVEIPEAFNVIIENLTRNTQDDFDEMEEETRMIYDTLSEDEKKRQLKEVDKYNKEVKKMNEISKEHNKDDEIKEDDSEDIPTDEDEIDKEADVIKDINSGNYKSPTDGLPIHNECSCSCDQIHINGDTSYDDEYESKWLDDATETDLKMIDNVKLTFLSVAMLINGLDYTSLNGVALDKIDTKKIASNFAKDSLFVSDKCNQFQYNMNKMEFNARFVTLFLISNSVEDVIRYYVINHEKEDKKYIKGIRYATDWIFDGVISMLAKTKTGFDFRLRHGIKESIKDKKVQVGSMGTSNAILCYSKIFETTKYNNIKEHDQFRKALITGYDSFDNKEERKLSTGETMIYLARMAYMSTTGQFEFPTNNDWLTNTKGSIRDKHYCRRIICELGEALGIIKSKYNIKMSDMYMAFVKAHPDISKYTKASIYIPDKESKKDYIRGVKSLLFIGYIEQDSTIQNLVEKVCI